MRRLDLKNYTFNVPNQKGILEFKTYNFQKTLEDILPHHGLGLNGPELMRAMEVVEKVKKAEGEVLLTEDDYRLIIDTCTRFRGFQSWDKQFLKRVYRCQVIPDEEDLKLSDNGKEKK